VNIHGKDDFVEEDFGKFTNIILLYDDLSNLLMIVNTTARLAASGGHGFCLYIDQKGQGLCQALRPAHSRPRWAVSSWGYCT